MDDSPETPERWAVGDAYDAYMGRWSRLMSRQFLDWFKPEADMHWLEIGCGTGALTSSICALCRPASIVACDRSPSFIEYAQSQTADKRTQFVAAGAEALPERSGGFDVVVSGLVLNFMSDPGASLRLVRERLKPGGVVGAYIWDYSGGVEFLHYFWEEAVASDPLAGTLNEAWRFRVWNLSYLTTLFESAGLTQIQGKVLTIPTSFTSFEDYWRPFLGGTGPAPGYVASLPAQQRESLAERLKQRLQPQADGTIRLHARAVAIKGSL